MHDLSPAGADFELPSGSEFNVCRRNCTAVVACSAYVYRNYSAVPGSRPTCWLKGQGWSVKPYSGSASLSSDSRSPNNTSSKFLCQRAFKFSYTLGTLQMQHNAVDRLAS